METVLNLYFKPVIWRVAFCRHSQTDRSPRVHRGAENFFHIILVYSYNRISLLT